MRKRVLILGSTGSIGTQTLEVIGRHAEHFTVAGLSAGTNTALLAEQVRSWRPAGAALGAAAPDDPLVEACEAAGCTLYAGERGLLDLLDACEADVVVNGLVGAVGLLPTLRAIDRGMTVALANKETMVIGGALVRAAAGRAGVAVVPVDSEHSAIWQCLAGESATAVKRLWLTASGGPFRTRNAAEFAGISVDEALRHPTWDMGPKVTIDSATMMNKGLEVIEAQWLFDVPPDAIRIVVHPESIVHSAVEFADGSIKAQLGAPDMRIPIQCALTYPERLPGAWATLDLLACGALHFEAPDPERFPCLRLAYEAAAAGGTMPAVLNAANEAAVALFLAGDIGFMDIPRLIEQVMADHRVVTDPELEDVLSADAWARDAVRVGCVAQPA